MAEIHLVDGYNVIYQSRKLQQLMQQDMETAREAFIDKVAHFCIQTGARVVVVFDGRGQQVISKVAHNRNVPNLEVLYSPGHLTADAVIERMVYQKDRKMEAIVVTSDRGVRDLCRGMGALVMDAPNFLRCIEETRTSIQETVQNTRKPAPSHLEERLDADSLAKLAALRKKL